MQSHREAACEQWGWLVFLYPLFSLMFTLFFFHLGDNFSFQFCLCLPSLSLSFTPSLPLSFSLCLSLSNSSLMTFISYFIYLFISCVSLCGVPCAWFYKSSESGERKLYKLISSSSSSSSSSFLSSSSSSSSPYTLLLQIACVVGSQGFTPLAYLSCHPHGLQTEVDYRRKLSQSVEHQDDKRSGREQREPTSECPSFMPGREDPCWLWSDAVFVFLV